MSNPRSPGGVVSIYKKYTVGSVGIWEKLRRLLAVDPNRSTGVPLNTHFRYPAPGSVPGVTFEDPVTLPAGDIAENPYWKRDVRRNYSRPSVYRQNDIAGLLTVGSAAAPRIGKGAEGEKQLVAVKAQENGILAQVLESQVGAAKDVLGPNGLPPLPGKQINWVQDPTHGYEGKYPCRSFA